VVVNKAEASNNARNVELVIITYSSTPKCLMCVTKDRQGERKIIFFFNGMAGVIHGRRSL
jgi:hypothetical protein